jgi:hypothetical protein
MKLIAEISGSACLATRGCVRIETANDERLTTDDQQKNRHQIFADGGNQMKRGNLHVAET